MLCRLIIGMTLVALAQFTGQPNVLYYAPLIFEAVGFHSVTSATLASVGLGSIKVVFTTIALLTIDRVGRRLYLLIGVSFMMVSIIVMGGVSKSLLHDQVVDSCVNHSNITANITNLPQTNYLPLQHDNESQLVLHNSHNKSLQRFSVILSSSHAQNPDKGKESDRHAKVHSKIVKWVGLASLMIYVAGYAVSFGPVTWLILSEIFPSSLKGRAISMATVFNWGTNLIISMTFLQVISKIGISWTFIGYGIICGISIVFIYFFVPETKGRTLEEISSDLRGDGSTSIFGLRCSRCCKKKTMPGGHYQRVALNSTHSQPEPVFTEPL